MRDKLIGPAGLLPQVEYSCLLCRSKDPNVLSQTLQATVKRQKNSGES